LKQLEQIIKRRRIEARYRSLLFDDGENVGEIVGEIVGNDGRMLFYDGITSEQAVEKLFTLQSDFLKKRGSIVKSDPEQKDILIKPLGVGIPLPFFIGQPQILIIDYN
jgi:hypothetical protein